MTRFERRCWLLKRDIELDCQRYDNECVDKGSHPITAQEQSSFERSLERAVPHMLRDKLQEIYHYVLCDNIIQEEREEIHEHRSEND